jgi:hypothetical protein
MARTQPGLVISIKAFIPLTRDLNQNLEALTLAKQAHETGDYSHLIAAATVDEVKVEQRSRRVEDAPVAPVAEAEEPAGPLLNIMVAAPVAAISTGEERIDPADAA